MAGAGEPSRQLRAREVTAVRSAPVRSNVGTAGASKRTKAAVKRAANDDSQRMAITAPTQQSKRRAALTNLTNQSNASSIRSSNVVAKAQVGANKGKGRATVDVKQEAPVDPPLPVNKVGSSNRSGSVLDVKDDEDVSSETTLSIQSQAGSEAKLVVRDSGADAIAALEKETKLNLYISNETKACASQDDLMLDNQSQKPGYKYMDIDRNYKDPQICSSYVTDIYHYLRVSELKRRPSIDYMEAIQHDVNASMRGILVDWLVEVAEEYKLVPDTLYLTVSYIDRFLSSKMVNRQRLQLLGVACMLIAAKYEEICAPQVEEFCYITDNTYCRDEVLDKERQVLDQLHFELSGPTTKTFLRRFLRAAQYCQKSPSLHLEFLGNYLTELTLVEYDFLKYLPSLIAASAVFVAKFSLDPSIRPWNATLQHYTGYGASVLKDCVQAMHSLQHNKNNCTLPAIREKYGQHKFKCVANLASPEVIPCDYFEDLDD